MRRFYIRMQMGHPGIRESVIGEGVLFHNENAAVLDYLTSTMLFFSGMESIITHYAPINIPRIEWVDYPSNYLNTN